MWSDFELDMIILMNAWRTIAFKFECKIKKNILKGTNPSEHPSYHLRTNNTKWPHKLPPEDEFWKNLFCQEDLWSYLLCEMKGIFGFDMWLICSEDNKDLFAIFDPPGHGRLGIFTHGVRMSVTKTRKRASTLTSRQNTRYNGCHAWKYYWLWPGGSS